VVPLGDEQDGKEVALPKEASSKRPAKPKSKSPTKPKTKPKPVTPPVAKAVPDKAIPGKGKGGQVNAWVVQVGSFADRKNARALRDKLRQQGHASFVESVNGKSGRVYRVRVGPELTRAAADKLRQRLAKEAGLKGLVQAYP
jgi:DedD protein